MAHSAGKAVQRMVAFLLMLALLQGWAAGQDAKAYVIGFLDIRDPGYLEEYLPQTMRLIEKHGGRNIVGDDSATRLEGEMEVPTLVFVVEFTSIEQAKAWYSDPEYVPLIELRQTAADLNLFVVEAAAQ